MNPEPVSVAVDIARVQYLAVAGSLVLLALIFELTRRKRIRVQYSILWFAASLAFLTVSIWRNGLELFARLVGVAYPPAAIFLVLILGIFAILIHFSVVASRLSEQNRVLTQQLASIEADLLQRKSGEPPRG
jgi:hypothetical protein